MKRSHPQSDRWSHCQSAVFLTHNCGPTTLAGQAIIWSSWVFQVPGWVRVNPESIFLWSSCCLLTSVPSPLTFKTESCQRPPRQSGETALIYIPSNGIFLLPVSAPLSCPSVTLLDWNCTNMISEGQLPRSLGHHHHHHHHQPLCFCLEMPPHVSWWRVGWRSPGECGAARLNICEIHNYILGSGIEDGTPTFYLTWLHRV